MIKPIKIIQWNARSLDKAKLQEFKYNIRYHDPHIVIISETFWKDGYVPKISAFNTFYLNRNNHGGGVAILIKKNIRAASISLPQSPNIEAVGATIYQELTDILNATKNSLVIVGDLNAHSEVWEDHHQQNRCGRDVTDLLLNDNRLILCTPKNLGTRPNPNGRHNSTIDLTLTSPDLAYRTDIHTETYWGSDHLPIIIQLNTNSPPLTSQNDHWKFNKRK